MRKSFTVKKEKEMFIENKKKRRKRHFKPEKQNQKVFLIVKSQLHVTQSHQ